MLSRFLPEGRRLETPENLAACSSLSGLLSARDRGQILEGMALSCSPEHDLTVSLGPFLGVIPRPETEELVGLVLSLYDEHFSDRDHVDVFDVATGSGAIGITLNLEERKMDVIASDISSKAIDVAYQNNEKLDGHVQFLVGNMLDPFIDRDLHCDICVCNPPYIPSHEQMEHSVVDYEPHVALFGGEDGLKFYRELFEKADQVLRSQSFLAFEIGYDQREALSALAKSYFPDAKIQVHKDMSGKDRMLTIERGF